jgi:hypothetical protein
MGFVALTYSLWVLHRSGGLALNSRGKTVKRVGGKSKRMGLLFVCGAGWTYSDIRDIRDIRDRVDRMDRIGRIGRIGRIWVKGCWGGFGHLGVGLYGKCAAWEQEKKWKSLGTLNAKTQRCKGAENHSYLQSPCHISLRLCTFAFVESYWPAKTSAAAIMAAVPFSTSRRRRSISF